MYRKGGDLLKSVSWALGTNIDNCSEQSYEHVAGQSKSPININKTLTEAGDIIVNDIFHSEMKKIAQTNSITGVEMFDEQIMILTHIYGFFWNQLPVLSNRGWVKRKKITAM